MVNAESYSYSTCASASTNRSGCRITKWLHRSLMCGSLQEKDIPNIGASNLKLILKCSCSTFAHIRLPYHHLVAVLHAVGSPNDVTSAFHISYLVKNFRQSCMGKAIPVVISTKTIQFLSTHYRTTSILDASKKRSIGSSEDTNHGGTYKCRACTQLGHNGTTCRRHANSVVHKNEKVATKEIFLGDVSYPLMALEFVTTATAVPDNLPNETHKRSSISMLLN